jgi:hypothetical protein
MKYTGGWRPTTQATEVEEAFARAKRRKLKTESLTAGPSCLFERLDTEVTDGATELEKNHRSQVSLVSCRGLKFGAIGYLWRMVGKAPCYNTLLGRVGANRLRIERISRNNKEFYELESFKRVWTSYNSGLSRMKTEPQKDLASDELRARVSSTKENKK